MASLLQSVKNCIIKTPVSEQVEVVTNVSEEKDSNENATQQTADDIKEHDDSDYRSDKKTDEQAGPAAEGGLLWRMSSGLYSTTATAVGYSVGGVKWVAGKSYDVGSSVAGHIKVPAVPSFRRKDKKE